MPRARPMELHDLRPAMREGSDRGRIAALAAKLFAAAIDHAPHAHAFEYSEEAVLDATASARKYAVAQARALLAEVDHQPKSRVAKRASLQEEIVALRDCFGPGEVEAAIESIRADRSPVEGAEYSTELQRITRERDALLEFCRPCDIEQAHASLAEPSNGNAGRTS